MSGCRDFPGGRWGLNIFPGGGSFFFFGGGIHLKLAFSHDKILRTYIL